MPHARVASTVLRIGIRILTLLFLLALIFTATRAMVRALPGDPLETLIAESGTSISSDSLRHDLRLDRPFWEALRLDFQDLTRGKLGTSLISRRPVAPLVATRFLKTLNLVLVALALNLCFSVFIGVLAAAKRGGWMDRFCTLHGAFNAALPIPWIGPIFLVLFSVWIPLFPSGEHWALPAITLALSFSGLWSRLIRERVRETLERGASQGARARGVPEWKVFLKYGLVPASGSLVAFLGTQFGNLMAGTFVIEMIFNWHGMGSLLIEAVLKRDYPVVEAGTFIAASCSLMGTWLGDLAQNLIDPRTSEGAFR